MTLSPSAISLLGAVGLVVVPSAIILASNFLAFRARRFAASRWQADIDAERRQAEQSARVWVDLYDRQDARVTDLEKRVRTLEMGSEDSNQNLAVICTVVRKAESSLRKVNLWDSTRPGQIT